MMARINPNIFEDWQDGDKIDAYEYKREREIIVTAINSLQDQVDLGEGETGENTTIIAEHSLMIRDLQNAIDRLDAKDAAQDLEMELLEDRLNLRIDGVELSIQNIQNQIDTNNQDLTALQNEIIVVKENKLDKDGDFEGTWHGLDPDDFTKIDGDHEGTWRTLTPDDMYTVVDQKIATAIGGGGGQPPANAEQIRRAGELPLTVQVVDLGGVADPSIEVGRIWIESDLGDMTDPLAGNIVYDTQGFNSPITADEVIETPSKVFVSPEQRTQIGTNTSSINSLDHRIQELEERPVTDEKVKMSENTEAKYLGQLIDGNTVDEVNGKLIARSLLDLQASIAELNYTKGVTSPIQDQLNTIGENEGYTKEEVDTKITDAIDEANTYTDDVLDTKLDTTTFESHVANLKEHVYFGVGSASVDDTYECNISNLPATGFLVHGAGFCIEFIGASSSKLKINDEPAYPILNNEFNPIGEIKVASFLNLRFVEGDNPAFIAVGEIESGGGITEQDVDNKINTHAQRNDVHGLRSNSVALGVDSTAHFTQSVAIGREAHTNSAGSTALGYLSRSYAGSTAVGDRAESTGQYSVALGRFATALNNNEGVLGGSDTGVPNKWNVPGDFSVSGTKNFEIPHPQPDKKSSHRLRHSAVESPTAGDTLYRFKVESKQEDDKQYITLPDYFIHLNKDVQIFVTPQGHYGNGYGVLNEETEQLEIHCQYEGEYNVLVIGTRNDDHQSVQDWHIKGVEREIGESWTGETYAFSVDEIIDVKEIKEESE